MKIFIMPAFLPFRFTTISTSAFSYRLHIKHTLTHIHSKSPGVSNGISNFKSKSLDRSCYSSCSRGQFSWLRISFTIYFFFVFLILFSILFFLCFSVFWTILEPQFFTHWHNSVVFANSIRGGVFSNGWSVCVSVVYKNRSGKLALN